MTHKKYNGISFYYKVIRNAFLRFYKDDISTHSAALAYFMVFALPSILVIIFWLAGIWYKNYIITETVINEFAELMGQEGAKQLVNTLNGLTSEKPSLWAAIIGVGTLFFMATTVFVTMIRTLNKIFKVDVTKIPRLSIWKFFFDRLVSVAMIGVVAIIVTFSISMRALMTSFSMSLERWMGFNINWLLVLSLVVLNILLHTLLFAIAYKYMSDSKLKWNTIWFGAFFTAVLFIVGKMLIAFFIGFSKISNFYDAAGSILLLMVWVFFSSMIFYFGAIIISCYDTQRNVDG